MKVVSIKEEMYCKNPNLSMFIYFLNIYHCQLIKQHSFMLLLADGGCQSQSASNTYYKHCLCIPQIRDCQPKQYSSNVFCSISSMFLVRFVPPLPMLGCSSADHPLVPYPVESFMRVRFDCVAICLMGAPQTSLILLQHPLTLVVREIAEY